jgi:hypothetical protein
MHYAQDQLYYIRANGEKNLTTILNYIKVIQQSYLARNLHTDSEWQIRVWYVADVPMHNVAPARNTAKTSPCSKSCATLFQ